MPTLINLDKEHTAAVKAGNLSLAYEIAKQILSALDAEAAKGPRGRNFRKPA